MRIRFCKKCREYTLESKCRKDHDTSTIQHKYKPEDKHFRLRTEEIKREFETKCINSENLKKLT